MATVKSPARFAVVNPRTLELAITVRAPRRGAVIPLAAKSRQEFALSLICNPSYADRLSSCVLYEVLYPARYRQQRGNILYSLWPPDPWMITVAGVMWQGIAAGASWDTVKLALAKALTKLRGARVAPLMESGTKANARLGFHWIEYTEGRKQRELFVGLQRAYRKAQRQKSSWKKSEPMRLTHRPKAGLRKRARSRSAPR